MSPSPIDPRIHSRGGEGNGESQEGVDEARFKAALARWVSGVCIIAVRDPDDGQVHATTVSSLGGVSATPPRIVFSLGPGAQVLPFLPEGQDFAVNILTREQKDLADRFTDSFPLGPSPFPEEGPPILQPVHALLICEVETIVPVDASRLVVARVLEAEADGGGSPLVRYERSYRTVD